MTVYGTYVPKQRCRHGKFRGQCFAGDGCEHSNALSLDDPRRYFGKDSSSAEATRLMRESPERYAAMKEKARALGIIAF